MRYTSQSEGYNVIYDYKADGWKVLPRYFENTKNKLLAEKKDRHLFLTLLLLFKTLVRFGSDRKRLGDRFSMRKIKK